MYYLIPLCIHVALPFLPNQNVFLNEFLLSPVATPIQQLHACSWFIGPLIIYVIGSYCLDSDNGFCFFPGS